MIWFVVYIYNVPVQYPVLFYCLLQHVHACYNMYMLVTTCTCLINKSAVVQFLILLRLKPRGTW